MKISSLTMRIWISISVFICSIVILFLFVFALVLKDSDERSSHRLFEFMHSVVLNELKGNALDDHSLDSIKREPITHFVYNEQDKQTTYMTGEKSTIEDSLLQAGMDFDGGPDSRIFTKKIEGQAYLVQISAVDNHSVLFSYEPLSFNEDMKQIIIAGLLIVLFSLPISKLIANNIGKPLKQIEGYTKRIANKDWDSELNIERKDEIGKLADSMKEMKEALRMADEEERKFLQSISHDLKTPVMIISSYAQAIVDGLYKSSPEEPALIIKTEAARLEKKIKQILYLNTLDYMLENDKDIEDVLLDKLLTYLVAHFKAVGPELIWDLQIKAKPAVMSGNPDRVRTSIENILENQLRFARNIVEVKLKDAGAFWTIEIRNDGPLLSEEDRNQIFTSFYKGVKGNFGLGLNITSKIVHFYGGTVTVENQNGYVCFKIGYPKS